MMPASPGGLSALVLAPLFTAIGIACLYRSWRLRRSQRRLVSAGWCALLAALIAWIQAMGAEFGIPMAFLWLSLCAWVAVALGLRRRRGSSAMPYTRTAATLPDRHTVLQHTLLAIVAVPLAGAAATIASVALAAVLPFGDISALVAGVLTLPLLWGLGAYWATADSQLIRPAAALGLCCLAGSTLLYL